jgi:hypothetical protein
MIRDVYPGSRIFDFSFQITDPDPGSRGGKKLWLPDPDTQQWVQMYITE